MSNQPFFIDTFREFLDQYNRKEISISKLVEDLNTVAHSWATDSEKKATWTVRDIDLITDYADFDEKAKIKMIEDRIQKFWKDNPSTPSADVQERAKQYIRSKYGNPVKRGSVTSIDDVGDAYLAGASSGMQWVKVYDRLPKEEGYYRTGAKHWMAYFHPDNATWTMEGNVLDIDYWLDESPASSMQGEADELRDWKESATKILDKINLQEVGKVLGVGLGQDIAINILPEIKALKAENEMLREALDKIVNHDNIGGFNNSYHAVKNIAREALTK